jgi:predicted small metal-binding protein
LQPTLLSFRIFFVKIIGKIKNVGNMLRQGGSRERRGRKLSCARLCDCHRSISGSDDDELFGEVLAHLSRDHPATPFSEERVGEPVLAASGAALLGLKGGSS